MLTLQYWRVINVETTDPLPLPQYTVGLTYNLKKGIKSEIEDIEAEYDSIDTVLAIKKALEDLGCKVELFEACSEVLKKIYDTKMDIVFNIAEGMHGRGREAQIPAILSFLNIPFTGSDETSLCISLDKALTKRILATHKIKTPRYQLFVDYKEKLNKDLRFPLIIKPNAEGSSKGISDFAIVQNEEELQFLLRKNFDMYNGAMLVEEYIHGREFTVAIVGNGSDAMVFPPMEICYRENGQKYNIYSYNVKKDYKKHIEYICPAPLDIETEAKMKNTARKIYRALECKDFARIDFRMSDAGEMHFIEINPLPGLAPGYSDYPMIAEFNGVDYGTIIRLILNSALTRHGMQSI